MNTDEQECFTCSGGDFAQKTRENIEEFGVSIVGTQHEISIGTIQMTYSIGITETLNKPELIIFGIPTKHAQTFINMYMQMLRDGKEFKAGVEYPDFASGFMTRLKEISRDSYMDHLCQAYEFNIQNNNDIKAMQFIFPDKEGKWPEDPEVDPKNLLMLNILD